MKTSKLFFALAIMLMALGCNAQQREPKSLTERGLIGKVKSVRKSKFEAIDKFGKITKGKRTSDSDENTFTIYNKKGNMIEINRYYSDGSLEKKGTFKYDDKGNMIEHNVYNSGGSLDDKWTVKYDDKGNESNWYNSDGSLEYKKTYKYDDKGNTIEKNWYNSYGSLYDKWTYKYDDKGNTIERNRYYSYGSLDKKWTCKYDDKGNTIEWYSYNSDGILNNKYAYNYNYDKQGNWILKIWSKNTIPLSIKEREIIYYD